MAILELELLAEMALALNSEVYWQGHRRRPIDKERIAFIRGEAEKVLAADEVLAAASAWCDEQYVPGALDATVGDAEPLGDAA